jgi:heme-degrading monooxygenase HmoA
MPAVLFVRVTSDLDPEELERRMQERLPRFREVPGLVQKVYARDETTGSVCGIYFFESQEALAAYRSSELAGTIASAYEAVEVRPEVYSVLRSLWPDRGPLS